MPNDILLEGFDLMTANGDLVTGEATRQHQQLLLLAEKGEIRDLPMRGVGLQTWLHDEQAGSLNGQVKREFEADGMTVEAVKGSGANLQIEAKYEDDDG